MGSHNWTKRAILGLNVEASLVVRLKDSSPLFAAASDYLAHMKAIAEPFDLAKVDFYKALQRKMTNGLTPVMELEAEDGASASDTTITVFGTDRKDLTQAGHGAPRDPRGAARPAVRRAVPLPGDNPALRAVVGLRRRGRRHLVLAEAVRLSEGPAVRDVAAVGPDRQAVLNTAEYFVTVRLGALDPSLVAVQPPARAAVMEEVADEVSPLLARLDADARAQLFGGREIRVRRPAVAADEAVRVRWRRGGACRSIRWWVCGYWWGRHGERREVRGGRRCRRLGRSDRRDV